MATAARGRSVWRIFRFPALLGFFSVVGLMSALLGDGVWDAASWMALAFPVATIIFFLSKRPAPSRKAPL